MLNVPKLFECNGTPDVRISDVLIESDYHWIEFIAHLSRVKHAPLPNTKEQLELLLQENHSPRKRAVLYAGLARYHKSRGDLLKATKLLGYAFSLLSDCQEDDESRAFITIEMAIMLTLTGNVDLSSILLEKVMSYSQSEYLQRNAGYRLFENRMRQNDKGVVKDLLNSLTYFKKVSQHHIVAYHYKSLGNACRRMKDYDRAMEFYRLGMDYANTHGSLHIVAAIMHDIGMLEFHRGNSHESLQNLSDVITLSDNHYVKSAALANMGYVHFHSENIAKATGCFQRSLDIATENGVYHRLPGLCYYLGVCNEKNDEFDSAEFFFKKGYQSSMELLQHHFPSSGDILLAIRGYFDFIETHKEYRFQAKTKKRNIYSHTIDKSLKEIRMVFQNALLEETILRAGSKRRAAVELGIAERSLFSILERVSSVKGYKVPEEINRFIRKNKTTSWKAVNQKYEQEVLSYLYKEYGQNKRRLAENLEVSYPSILNLTATIGKSLVTI